MRQTAYDNGRKGEDGEDGWVNPFVIKVVFLVQAHCALYSVKYIRRHGGGSNDHSSYALHIGFTASKIGSNRS